MWRILSGVSLMDLWCVPAPDFLWVPFPAALSVGHGLLRRGGEADGVGLRAPRAQALWCWDGHSPWAHVPRDPPHVARSQAHRGETEGHRAVGWGGVGWSRAWGWSEQKGGPGFLIRSIKVPKDHVCLCGQDKCFLSLVFLSTPKVYGGVCIKLKSALWAGIFFFLPLIQSPSSLSVPSVLAAYQSGGVRWGVNSISTPKQRRPQCCLLRANLFF